MNIAVSQKIISNDNGKMHLVSSEP